MEEVTDEPVSYFYVEVHETPLPSSFFRGLDSLAADYVPRSKPKQGWQRVEELEERVRKLEHALDQLSSQVYGIGAER